MKIYDINKYAEKAVNDQNNTPLDDFDGLTPNQMEQILYNPFENNTVIKFTKKTVPGIVAESPLFLIAWDLLSTLSEKNGVKLSSKGCMPFKLVKSIYDKGYLQDELIDDGEIEFRSEYDWLLLFVVRHLLIITELAEIKNNTLLLTKHGADLLEHKADYTIYMELLKAFCLGFGWASTDYYASEEIGQVGFMFMLYLLKKYGGTPRNPAFYEEKYFRAFPMLYVEDDDDEDEDEDDDDKMEYSEHEEDLEEEEELDIDYVPDPEEERMDCLEVRFFERFCLWFGLADVELNLNLPGGEPGFEMFENIGTVKRSNLFERIIV